MKEAFYCEENPIGEDVYAEHSLKDEIRKTQVEAMRTVMEGDRIRNRAKACEMYVFDEMTRGYGNDANREERIERSTKEAYEIGRNL